jgi:hypothetical protein
MHSVRMPRDPWVSCLRSCTPTRVQCIRQLVEFLCSHRHPPGETATSSWVCLHVLMVYSHNTNNPMGSAYSIVSPVAPSRVQGPPPDPQLNYDPDVHEMYREFVRHLRSSPGVLTFFLSLRLQALLKDPKNQTPTALVNIRREKQVILALALHSQSYHPISSRGWEGLLLPQTRSVDSVPQVPPMGLLKLSIQVLACSTGDVNVRPCGNCWSRERPDHNVLPYMIDFKAQSHKIALSTHQRENDNCVKADVKFHFTCYSRHHGGPYR